MIPDAEIGYGHYWILVEWPGAMPASLEVGIPYRDEDGKIEHWDTCWGKVHPGMVVRVVQAIPEPQL